MEALLTEQRTEIDELNRLITNYHKDGPSRKVERYLVDKMNNFTESFRVILENDRKIQQLKSTENVDQPYFKEKTFEKLQKAFDTAMADIQNRLQCVGSSLAAASNPSVASVSNQPPLQHPLTQNISNTGLKSMDSTAFVDATGTNGSTTRTPPPIGDHDHLNRQEDNQFNLENHDVDNEFDAAAGAGDENDGGMLMVLYNDVMDMLATSRDLSNETSHGFLIAHSSNLNSIWTEFRSAVYQERAAGRKTPFNFSVLFQKYLSASGKINDLVKKPQNCEQSANIQFNLPKLQLPEFHGKISDWKRFIALFDRMVHKNVKIDNGMKIEYLKTCVKGQAARIINHIDPNPDNYITCYELLRYRYENKRELLGALIDGILLLPKLKTENADMLKSMHDTVYESIMSIRNIEISTDNWDPLLCHILTRKLDASTLIHYECQLQDVREIQSLQSLLKYLESRFNQRT